MSSTIEIRLYGDEDGLPAAGVGKLARAVSAWHRFEGPWQNIHALNARKDVVAAEESPMSDDRLAERALAWNAANRSLTAACSVPFWTFRHDRPPKIGPLPLEIEAWGPKFNHFRVAQFDGYARILIERAGPFYAALGPEAAHPDVPAMNACVQDNVDALLELISIVRERVKPASIKVFDDEGLRLPFNAYYARYRDPLTLVRELKLLAHAWENGLPWYPDDPPLKSFDARAHTYYLHLLRSEAQRDSLYRRLAALLPRAAELSDESLRTAVLSNRKAAAASGQVEIYHRELMINHFIDEDLLDILGAAVTA